MSAFLVICIEKYTYSHTVFNELYFCQWQDRTKIVKF